MKIRISFFLLFILPAFVAQGQTWLYSLHRFLNRSKQSNGNHAS